MTDAGIDGGGCSLCNFDGGILWLRWMEFYLYKYQYSHINLYMFIYVYILCIWDSDIFLYLYMELNIFFYKLTQGLIISRARFTNCTDKINR